jgi:hypothetical protein
MRSCKCCVVADRFRATARGTNLYPDKGKLAPSNAALVEKAAKIVEVLGDQVATPADARQILGLNGRNVWPGPTKIVTESERSARSHRRNRLQHHPHFSVPR